MKKIIVAVLFLSLMSCSLRPPDGSKELMEDIERDRKLTKPADVSFEGRPIFVKVRAYPQIRNGHIYGRHWILMRIGREKIAVDELVKPLSE